MKSARGARFTRGSGTRECHLSLLKMSLEPNFEQSRYRIDTMK